VVGLSGHTGNVAEEMRYEPFGALLSTPPSGPITLRYTGREHDPASGLYYYRARYYDPEIGRFLSEDPLGFGAGDVNLYAYVGNNPLLTNDPTGECALLCTAAIGGVIGATISTTSYLLTNNGSVTAGGVLSAAGVGFATGALIGAGGGTATGFVATRVGALFGSTAQAGVQFGGTLETGAASGYGGSVAGQVVDTGSFSAIDQRAAQRTAVLGAGAAFLPAVGAAGSVSSTVSYTAGQQAAMLGAWGFYDHAAGTALDVMFNDWIQPNPYYQPDYPRRVGRRRGVSEVR
jgi:RHS repeat-associated protein